MSFDFDSRCCSNSGGLESVRSLTAIEYRAFPHCYKWVVTVAQLCAHIATNA